MTPAPELAERIEMLADKLDKAEERLASLFRRVRKLEDACERHGIEVPKP